MTEKTLSECFTLLSTMNAGREQPWSAAHKPGYALVLVPMECAIGKAAVNYAVMTLEWRPSPAELRRIAATLAAPVPDDSACYMEILFKAERLGEYGKPHPERPGIRMYGEPQFSHPIIGQIVAYCGGWTMICQGEANMQEGLRKQIRSAHESASRQWLINVSSQILLPAAQRDSRYFAAYDSFRAPDFWLPDHELPALPEAARPELLPIPESVRRVIESVKVKTI